MTLNIICDFFILFIMYAIIGYICEVITCSIADKKLSFFRGFLIGPWIPIYGFGALLITLTLSNFNNWFIIFILSMLICSALEYLTSYIMEKIYKMRWWDYSNEKYNLNGRVCLKNAILFGLGGIGVILIINPFIFKYIENIPINIRAIISLVLFILYSVDSEVSNHIVNKLKDNANKYASKDASEELKGEILFEVSKNIKAYSRILKAFPHAFKDNNHRFDEFNNYILSIITGFKKVGKDFRLKLADSYINKRIIKDLNQFKKDFKDEYYEVKKEYKFMSDELHGIRATIKKAIHRK